MNRGFPWLSYGTLQYTTYIIIYAFIQKGRSDDLINRIRKR